MKNKAQARKNGSVSRISQQLKTPAEFKIVRLRECPVDSPQVDNPVSAVDFWRKHVTTTSWFKEDKECLCVFLLNSRKRLIGFELVSQGTLDTILVHPRDVLRLATMRSAAGILIAHNHPSGDPLPSDGDIAVTRQLIQAAQQLKIELIDHVIIGDARREKGHSSLRELGYFYADEGKQALATKATNYISRVCDCAENVRIATTESNVLFELIHAHQDWREHREGSVWDRERTDLFNDGLYWIIDHVQRKTAAASKSLMDVAYRKESQPASNI